MWVLLPLCWVAYIYFFPSQRGISYRARSKQLGRPGGSAAWQAELRENSRLDRMLTPPSAERELIRSLNTSPIPEQKGKRSTLMTVIQLFSAFLDGFSCSGYLMSGVWSSGATFFQAKPSVTLLYFCTDLPLNRFYIKWMCSFGRTR